MNKRPALRYHGGKWRLAPWIISHFPKHERYCEPFCGAASVLLRKTRSDQEIINDLSGTIVNVFRVLRDPEKAELLKDQLALTPFSREEYDAAFDPCEDDPVEWARRAFVRSFQSHAANGLFRKDVGFRLDLNSRRTTEHTWKEVPQHISTFTERLQGVVIESRPAPDIITRVDSKRTLQYVDPPYVHSTRTRSNGYAVEMTDDEHRELAELLHSVKAMIIISGYPCPLYDELYSDWECISREHVANCAKQTTECIWISPNAITQPTLDL